MLGKRARPVREGVVGSGPAPCWRHARRPTSLIGEFKNAGREWRPTGTPIDVDTHDFPDKELGADAGGSNGYRTGNWSGRFVA